MWCIATAHSRREYQLAGRALWQRLQFSAHICVRPRAATAGCVAAGSSPAVGGGREAHPPSAPSAAEMTTIPTRVNLTLKPHARAQVKRIMVRSGLRLVEDVSRRE